MSTWKLQRRQLKLYPHFDAILSLEQATALASDPDRVAAHTFFPFLVYEKRLWRFKTRGKGGAPKVRKIRYAARADAYIFARYRHLLSDVYEKALAKRGLAKNVIAYRRISDPISGAGMTNIHHARDAISHIRSMRTCAVVALDISSFFENLDHGLLKKHWAGLLGADRLPADHHAVYKAITGYAEVDQEAAFLRLGHMGEKIDPHTGKKRIGFLTPKNKMPKQLCVGRDFRLKIAWTGSIGSLIRLNRKPYGIPQGSPISDLLANFYLIDFDEAVSSAVGAAGGIYLRYSDDILIIVPGGETEGLMWKDYVTRMIGSHGSKLVIKDEKSSVFEFFPDGADQAFRHVYGLSGREGFEYLGFRYNGSGIYIRNSTLSNLRRKVATRAAAEARACARRYPDKDIATLQSLLDIQSILKNFGKVADFEEVADQPKSWTFWTYAKKAIAVFGADGECIRRQMSRHKRHVIDRANKELAYAAGRRPAHVVTRSKRSAPTKPASAGIGAS